MKETYVCLIPKKPRANKVEEFCLISLTTSLYEIIAKVLVERLRKVLLGTIANTQAAFVESRKILDAILLALEIVGERKAKKKKGFLLNLNYKKTYGKVDWYFLDDIMTKKGFGAKWRM